MENQEMKWHEKPVWIYLLVVFFFPVGLYLLWKKKGWTVMHKIIVTILFLGLATASLMVDNQKGWKRVKKIVNAAFD